MDKTNDAETLPQTNRYDTSKPDSPRNSETVTGMASAELREHGNVSNSNGKHGRENPTAIPSATPARRASFVVPAGSRTDIRQRRDAVKKDFKPSTLAPRQPALGQAQKARAVTVPVKESKPGLRDANTLASTQRTSRSSFVHVPESSSQASSAVHRSGNFISRGSTSASRAHAPSIRAPAPPAVLSPVECDPATQLTNGTSRGSRTSVATSPITLSATTEPSTLDLHTSLNIDEVLPYATRKADPKGASAFITSKESIADTSFTLDDRSLTADRVDDGYGNASSIRHDRTSTLSVVPDNRQVSFSHGRANAPPTLKGDTGTVLPSRIPISTRYKRRPPIPNFHPSPPADEYAHLVLEAPESTFPKEPEVATTLDGCVAAAATLPPRTASSPPSPATAISTSTHLVSTPPTPTLATVVTLSTAVTPSSARHEPEASMTTVLVRAQTPGDNVLLPTAAAHPMSVIQVRDEDAVDSGDANAQYGTMPADVEIEPIPPTVLPTVLSQGTSVGAMEDAAAQAACSSASSDDLWQHELGKGPAAKRLGSKRTVGRSLGRVLAALWGRN